MTVRSHVRQALDDFLPKILWKNECSFFHCAFSCGVQRHR